jgi:hypothetical protein
MARALEVPPLERITRLRSARSASTPPRIENTLMGSTRVRPT